MNASGQDAGPGGHQGERRQSSDGSVIYKVECTNGATSNARRESKQLDPKLLAEDTASQHERYKNETITIPEPSASPPDNRRLLKRS